MAPPNQARALVAGPPAAPVVHAFSVACRSSREEMWPLVADTERLNLSVGNERVESTPDESSETAARFFTETRMGGLSLGYHEEPFEWEEHKSFSWRRDMPKGPASRITGSYVFEDAPDGGCVISVRLETFVRAAICRPFARVIQGRKARGVERYIRRADEAAEAHEPIRVAQSVCDRERAERSGARLSNKHDPALVKRLVDLVTSGGEVDVQRIRPFELARAWGAGRDVVLRMCLDAVASGLLELRWALLCPSCLVQGSSIPSLRELDPEGHCPSCDIRFGVELDRTVEAVFAPNPGVRLVDARPFCVGSPRLMPHIAGQAIARPPDPARLVVPEEPGRYRVFVRGGGVVIVDASPGAASEGAIEADAEGHAEPKQLDLAPGAEVFVSTSGPPLHAKIERVEFAFDAVTAMHVSALAEFRAQFGAEALRPGLALRVGRVAMLFSDLVGSTALYSKVGDAAAFGIVTDCLTFGREIVEKHGGTVVKTMGDAVMAAFTSPDPAIAAGADMIRAWSAFAASHPGTEELDLKVGVACGPCTIVTANGVLDYFGQTVNTAARVQHQAGARELVLPTDLLASGTEGTTSVRVLPPGLVVLERFEARVKGIQEPISLVRLGPDPPRSERLADAAEAQT